MKLELVDDTAQLACTPMEAIRLTGQLMDMMLMLPHGSQLPPSIVDLSVALTNGSHAMLQHLAVHGETTSTQHVSA